jgi:hypothetical protein
LDVLTWIHALGQSAPSAGEMLTRIRHLAWVRDLSWLHLLPLTALSAAVMALGLVILLELRAIARLRHALDGGLKRVFEQLDLLCFENQRVSATPSQSAVAEQTGGQAGLSPRPPSLRPSSLRPPLREPPVALPVVNAYQGERSLAGRIVPPEQSAERMVERLELGAGEARLLASLAAARARRTPVEAHVPGRVLS